MELYNIQAMLTGTAAVFTPAPDQPVKLENGVASFSIDPRDSGTVEKVTVNGEAIDFTFENGILKIPSTASGIVRASAIFTDGTAMTLLWSK